MRSKNRSLKSTKTKESLLMTIDLQICLLIKQLKHKLQHQVAQVCASLLERKLKLDLDLQPTGNDTRIDLRN